MTRVLLKLSGEAFTSGEKSGVDAAAVSQTAKIVSELHKRGVEIGIVMGGGNFFRGIQNGPSLQLERSSADTVGMLATMMNATILQQALQQHGAQTKLLSSFECPAVAERYRLDLALSHIKENIVLFAGGTGHPYFTTDTAAALRASEIKADILLKATTKVDAVYDSDPLKNSGAKPYQKLSYKEFLDKKLGILDLTAITLCMTNRVPIRVFNLYAGALDEALGGKFGTLIEG